MSLGDKVGGLILQANQRTIGPAGVASNLALWSGVSLATVLAFNILRPSNKIVYQPKLKYHVGNKKPPEISNGFFAWIPPLLHSKEPYLFDKIGMDAIIFLRFMRLLRWLFLSIAFLSCAVLIPINVTYNLASVDNVPNVPKDRRDALSMLTIRDVRGKRLYVHIASIYVFTFLVMGFVYYHWKAVLELRQTWFRSPEYNQSFYARTLLVQRVPKKLQSDEGLKSLFASLAVPYPATSVHISRRVGELPQLIEYHNRAVRDLERVLVRYLRGGKIGAKRPTLTIGGFMGMGGTKKDAIDFYTNRIRNAESAIERAREQIAASQGKAENYGFASMAAVPYAHIVAYTLRNKHPKGTVIESAPNPKDIIWENLNATDAALARKKTLGWIFLILVAFFNTIPVFAISVLANLNALATLIPFLAKIANDHVYLFAVVSGIAPPTVSAIFGYAFPYVMRWLSRYQGAYTQSRLDRAVVARYFAFIVISQLFIFTLIGVAFAAGEVIVKEIGKDSFADIVKNLNVLPDNINTTYINQSSYWLTFFPLRGFLVIFDLAQVLNLVWTWFRTHLLGRTPRDIREWTQPPDFEYSIYYVNVLFMATVGLIFAPLAPLVAAMACIVFFIGSLVYKYQLMFVFVTRVESGGRLWNVAINRLLFSVILMQCLFTLTIGLQLGWRSFGWVGTIPPIIMVLVFKAYIERTFNSKFRYFIPDEHEAASSQVHSERADQKGNRLANRFGHPALHADLFTPLLHAKMMPLLPMVYRGNLGTEKTKLEEYGGQNADARVTPEGLRIAGIDENNLEYDPVLYQRDRGELDWDKRSISTTNLLSDTASTSKAGFLNQGRDSPVPSLPGYNQYLLRGTNNQSEDLPLLQDTGSQIALIPNGEEYNTYEGQYSAPQAPAGTQYPPTAYRATPLPLGAYQPPPQVYQQQTDYYSQHTVQDPYQRPYSAQGQGPPGLGRTSPPQAQAPSAYQRPYAHQQQGSAGSFTQQGPYPHSRQTSDDSANMAGRGAGTNRGYRS
ncbi:hypothetical protein M422DRAFT_203398 [Sphaerobolus stellatus SS14]|nr:hypothetical protein M422DRAFT_203398 [Sphaerobolus stellatus SS14]